MGKIKKYMPVLAGLVIVISAIFSLATSEGRDWHALSKESKRSINMAFDRICNDVTRFEARCGSLSWTAKRRFIASSEIGGGLAYDRLDSIVKSYGWTYNKVNAYGEHVYCSKGLAASVRELGGLVKYLQIAVPDNRGPCAEPDSS